MCLKSITPTARISVCVCVCVCVSVCVSPKDVITMVIQKPVDYVVEKNLVDLYPAFGEIYTYTVYIHTLLGGRRESSSYFLSHAYCIVWLAVASTVVGRCLPRLGWLEPFNVTFTLVQMCCMLGWTQQLLSEMRQLVA